MLGWVASLIGAGQLLGTVAVAIGDELCVAVLEGAVACGVVVALSPPLLLQATVSANTAVMVKISSRV